MQTTTKNIMKIRKHIFSNNLKKRSGHMGQGKQQWKFERNLFDRFGDNCDRDD